MMNQDEAVLYSNGVLSDRMMPSGANSFIVRDGRIAAIGRREQLIGTHISHEVDLGARRVIPGLVDAHTHAVRGGATWLREMHWERVSDPTVALAEIRRRAEASPEGTWITALGGWHQSQFSGWLPRPDDLDDLAPHHPVYVQSLYEVGIANRAAIDRLGDAATTPGVERDDNGRPTGYVRGLPAFTALAGVIGVPLHSEEVAGTRALFSDLAGWGVTGIVDAGGFGMSPQRYGALDDIPLSELDVRVRTYRSVVTPGNEIEEASARISAMAASAQPELLRMVGLGEIIHFGCHDFEGLDGVQLSAATITELASISEAAAAAGVPIQIHAVSDQIVDLVLTTWERISTRYPIQGLRFAIAHVDRISNRNIDRLVRLGVGVILDDRQLMRGAASAAEWGQSAMSAVPPLGALMTAGVPVGMGTDGTRASSIDPWLALWWLIEGRTIDGTVRRSKENLLDRATALSVMTEGNSWFTRDEHHIGRLAVGYLADFAVLDHDYFAVPTEDIREITSELTVMNGRITHSAGAVG
jgi:predicted amidohydrolase YtcJ